MPSAAAGTWSPAELTEIDTEDELRIASRRVDGSLRREVIIWMVRVGDDMFVRAAHGPETGWNRRAHEAGAGHVRIGTAVDRDVLFEPADPALAGAVSDAFEAKYDGRHPREDVDPVVSAESLPTTLRIVPA
ncbi:hypothetical protein GCM10009840_18390 [Pseudolysinimonas kribbensis]|uniref:DUF2255 family protein n=1 Tax=Pseudolysinimonas kribbensis TaxID=433641 RepID=A0ABQ6JZJ8_9MICO|nr:DUF2255 family protein [Pseudolysinimonas kribbensis]GMA93777.1 hypothetical protein GCM10025881_06010 [Pseudolysinimonas kribbensis]